MKVKFFTLGCKVNQYETQALREDFKNSGFTETEGKADLYVINSCSVTAKADADSRRLILKLKKENPGAKVALCGCWPQLNSEEIKKTGVDYVVSQDEKQSLLNVVNGRDVIHKNIWSLKISDFPNQRAFVKIQDGCDNFCSFCKVPFLRGPSRSRMEDEILQEIKRLKIKHKEIVLCGINLGAYGKDLTPKTTLYALLQRILKEDSLGRLRVSSLEPYSVDRKFAGLFLHPKLCPHIHLPFQSGDDRTLKEMNKKETVAIYHKVVDNLRKINPEIAISCDIIVGFPSEDEINFNNTLSFLKEISPMRTHIFTFSGREKTRFYGCKINRAIVKKRFQQLKDIADSSALKYRKTFLGRTLNLVVEEIKSDYICGYTENYIKVYAKGTANTGEIIPVQINKVDNDKVFGVINAA